jgi:glutathione S-transferase
MAAHIVLCELGLPFELEKVDLGTKTTERGAHFLKINPKGYVPALELDSGEVLTEAGTILLYLADLKPGSGMAPPCGAMARYRIMEWLNFISSEIHKGFGPLWNPETPEATRRMTIANLSRRFDYLADPLAHRQFVMDDGFSVVDAYLFTVLGWSDYHKLDMSPWPALKDYMGRVAGRAAVNKAMREEGLVS